MAVARLSAMILAHVRERNAPAGTAWRLAAAIGPAAHRRAPRALARPRGRPPPAARRRSGPGPQLGPLPPAADDPRRPPRGGPAGRRPGRAGRGLRAARRRRPGRPAAADAGFGPPILRPASLRDFYAFEGHVATMWARRGNPVPEAWYRLPIFYFSNVSEIRGPGDPVWAPRGSAELDYELEVVRPGRHAGPRPAPRPGRGGDRRLPDPERLERPRPPARRDDRPARAGQGQGLRQLDRALARDPRRARRCPARRGERTGPGPERRGQRRRDVAGHAGPTPGSRSARCSPGPRPTSALRPGDLLGSGTVGSGCLLEVRDATLGRYLEPGDQVTLRVERLGALSSPIVARPG